MPLRSKTQGSWNCQSVQQTTQQVKAPSCIKTKKPDEGSQDSKKTEEPDFPSKKFPSPPSHQQVPAESPVHQGGQQDVSKGCVCSKGSKDSWSTRSQSSQQATHTEAFSYIKTKKIVEVSQASKIIEEPDLPSQIYPRMQSHHPGKQVLDASPVGQGGQQQVSQESVCSKGSWSSQSSQQDTKVEPPSCIKKPVHLGGQHQVIQGCVCSKGSKDGSGSQSSHQTMKAEPPPYVKTAVRQGGEQQVSQGSVCSKGSSSSQSSQQPTKAEPPSCIKTPAVPQGSSKGSVCIKSSKDSWSSQSSQQATKADQPSCIKTQKPVEVSPASRKTEEPDVPSEKFPFPPSDQQVPAASPVYEGGQQDVSKGCACIKGSKGSWSSQSSQQVEAPSYIKIEQGDDEASQASKKIEEPGFPPKRFPPPPSHQQVPAASPVHQGGQQDVSTTPSARHGTETPTVNPLAHCDPSSDASVLRKAMKGFGTDEAAIIGVLSHRSSDQRQQILLKYQQGYGRDTDGAGAEKGLTGDLVKDLKSELSGKFEEAILALMTPLPLYLAQEVHHAIQGIGTNERTLVEVLCTRDNQSLMAIKNAYYQHYRKKLEDDLRGDTSGDFRRLLISMCACSRDENTCDPALAPNLAQQLYNAGVGKVGTDEAEFNRILSTYSYPMLRIVFEEYKKIKGKSFGDALDSELSGDLKMGMRAVYDCIQNRAAYFAKELHDSMAGMGTRDRALIRLVVSRCEIDMGNIKQEYHKMYSKSLEHAIKSDTSGDYKKLLIALVGA
ncbi:uncharacterized protein LOC123501751 isoform X2 [Portunus trituberculatus]|uniref:uncharacterized protein LOC123501751 isoform X2 n=1 Tax=Portunus trituberculatus TaxID=210409 RepID=UPI001E1CBA1F|nr:uncharacterized protein LOC123501751 isoform X2 [Portunus trituberculatus]